MDLKSYLFALLCAAIGVIPWLLEKRGVAVPPFFIVAGGILTIVVLAIGLFHPLVAGLERQPVAFIKDHANTLAASFLALLVGIAGTWWVVTDRPKHDQYTIADYRKWQSDKRETISWKTFTNETVEIDGTLFDNCTFENVTLMFHGTAPPTFLKTTFKGTNLLTTDNKSATGFAIISNYLRTHSGEFEFGEQDTNTGQFRVFAREKRRPAENKQDQGGK